MTKRILVVDDDGEIVRLVRGYLEQVGYTVFVAYDGKSAQYILRRERPDLLLLDLMLPDKDGWDITRFIRSDTLLSDMPIIMLTARVEDADKIIGLELGADDYITKPFNPREVVARVNALLRRTNMAGAGKTTDVLQAGDLRLDMGRREVSLAGQVIDLTPTEFNLLRILMNSPGYAFTRGELIEVGLGYEYAGMERTLDSHIKNLRQKLEPASEKSSYIHTVYGVGYRFDVPQE